ncbi:GGDEF domain-containing protein [Hansschlegelia plantiphila]|uniref:GGDEF domain-containing protein n=1 Tax=Hansschlegelia plantiphila TaxID=374655 RepID=A0A9W6J0X5_9HYPH|nr:GGDEF domain-containing protein [Hansschlegelia plantiphila]GLK67683.1 hypothetical protein GCM10008179_13210 [Hansschlegelia plantiphila]
MKFPLAAPPSAAVLVELVGLLYSAAVPIVLIGAALTSVGVFAMTIDDDGIVAALTYSSIVITGARLLLVILYRRRAARLALTVEEARRWEQAYGAACIVAALCVGGFGARFTLLESSTLQTMGVALLFAYCAGQVTRVCIRPWICVPTLIAAALPVIVALAWRGGTDAFALAAFLLFFLFASFETVAYGHRTALTLILAKQQLAALARRDPLTGLENRAALRETIAAAALGLEGTGESLAVHCLDLDRFKEINDQHGHPLGDALLKAVAARLTGAIRAQDTVIRLGGDEFVVVQAGGVDPTSAEMLARRILQSIGAPFAIDGVELCVGVSIGIALAPKDGSTMDALMARADQALYVAKAKGRNSFRFFDPNDGLAANDAIVAAWRARKETA